ncbi:cyclin-dependent kinase 4 inhibitor C [Solea senegalensis]|nr:cyclin-dependent kinase 4 inhibitor C [Solea senegalensis]
MAEVPLTDRLSTASASGNLHELLLLLENGADVNGLNTFGRTPLQVVKLSCDHVIQALLEAGANPDVRDPVCGLTVTHDAARDGWIDAVRLLIDHKADPNMVDDRGNLPLHLAASRGHLRVVQLLMGHTQNPHTRNNEGRTAALEALFHGKMDTAKYIDEYLNPAH